MMKNEFIVSRQNFRNFTYLRPALCNNLWKIESEHAFDSELAAFVRLVFPSLRIDWNRGRTLEIIELCQPLPRVRSQNMFLRRRSLRFGAGVARGIVFLASFNQKAFVKFPTKR